MKKKLTIAFSLMALVVWLGPRPDPKINKNFSHQAIFADIPNYPGWDARELSDQEKQELDLALSQSFHHLGKGTQCFAFASEDEQYVIKFMRQKIFALPYWIEHHPIPFLVRLLRDRKVRKKQHDRNRIFSGFKDSFEKLPNETGLIFVHLNRTDHLHKTLQLTDEGGTAYSLNLDELEFVLQRRGVLFHDTIHMQMAKGDTHGAKESIDSILRLNLSLYKKGFYNRDREVGFNYAFLDSEPVLIDIGRLAYAEEMKQPARYKKEILRVKPKFRHYLEHTHPELVAHFDMSIAKILSDELPAGEL